MVVSDALLAVFIVYTHCLDLHVHAARSSSERIIDFCHVEHRYDAIIVPAVIAEGTAIITGEEYDVEVRHVNRRLVSKGKAWVRHDKPNSRTRSCYVEEGGIKDLDKGWGRVRGIETRERVIRTPLSVVCTHDIVFEGIDVLILLTISTRERQWRTHHSTRGQGEIRGGSGPRC